MFISGQQSVFYTHLALIVALLLHILLDSRAHATQHACAVERREMTHGCLNCGSHFIRLPSSQVSWVHRGMGGRVWGALTGRFQGFLGQTIDINHPNVWTGEDKIKGTVIIVSLARFRNERGS